MTPFATADTATRRLAHRLGHYRWFAAISRRLLTPIDRWLYRISDGRLSPVGRSVGQLLLLTTVGRRSGEPRTTPVIYVRDASSYIISSEDVGHARPAAWRLNLEACPCATVQVGAEVFDCRARVLGDKEADRYWPLLLEVWPAHETYRRRSGQRHTFALKPVDSGREGHGDAGRDRGRAAIGRLASTR